MDAEVGEGVAAGRAAAPAFLLCLALPSPPLSLISLPSTGRRRMESSPVISKTVVALFCLQNVIIASGMHAAGQN